MSLLTLPAGESVREVANRLGVPVEELQRHAGVGDVEAPLSVAQRVEVPDGFLRGRARSTIQREVVPTSGTRTGGMNAWLALDIEQKRTRAAGGVKKHAASEDEVEGLAEAQRAYERFEADSNELAIELYGNLSATLSTAVRAAAFAGQGCALAQRHIIYGEPLAQSQPQALSAAKAALLADPKLPASHLAMALALHTSAVENAAASADLQEAVVEIETGLRTDAHNPWCWAELTSLRLAQGDLEAAQEAADQATVDAGDCVLAFYAAAQVAQERGVSGVAQQLAERACELCPTFADARLLMATVLRATGDAAAADAAYQQARQLALRPAHRQRIDEHYQLDQADRAGVPAP